MPAQNVNWPIPLTRFKTLFPGQMGVPGTDNERGLRSDCHGTIFYVDPNAVGVSDGRDGTDPEAPLQTVAKALTLCQAYRNDVIAVMFNGYWTYADVTSGRRTPIAEQVTVDVPGVRIVGVAPSSPLGVPWVNTANSGVAITVDAIDVVIEGFCFWNPTYTGCTAILAQWDGVTAYADNLIVRNCFFYDEFAIAIDLDYCYNSYIEDCVFQSVDKGINNNGTNGDPDWLIIRNNVFTACTVAIDLDDTSYPIIEDNEIIDCPTGITFDGATAAKIKNNVVNITVGSGVTAIHGRSSSECVICGNVLNGDPTGTNNLIDLTGGSNAMVADNWLSCTIAQYDVTCSDATSGAWVRNHCVDNETAAAPV